MKRFLIKFCILAAMLLGLPLAGVALSGAPLRIYLEFPPETRYVSHAPFSWVAFVCYSLFILAAVAPLLIRAIQAIRRKETGRSLVGVFPWWGWLGIGAGLIAWILAWTRFPWFSRFQPHTFTPLWLSFIVVINALTYRRKGKCMMLNQPGLFLLLFPVSALFWWFFEYLNRFVQNWYYVGVRFSPWEYFWYATLSFSTVLPAVLGTREWILTSSCIKGKFERFLPIRLFGSGRFLGWVFLLLSVSGLAGIGIWPNYLFPLLWLSPLIIIVCLQSVMGEHHVLADIAQGNWGMLVASALAATFCGFFWEMWNYYSLAKWQYSVPFVNRFHVFEMPILGYAGYLPFGLECAVIGGMIENVLRGRSQKPLREGDGRP
jgi:hypothetical protein